jgi:prophage regulatory protein
VKAGKFPAPIKVGQNRIGWVESEIDEWLNVKIAERDARTKAA